MIGRERDQRETEAAGVAPLQPGRAVWGVSLLATHLFASCAPPSASRHPSPTKLAAIGSGGDAEAS